MIKVIEKIFHFKTIKFEDFSKTLKILLNSQSYKNFPKYGPGSKIFILKEIYKITKYDMGQKAQYQNVQNDPFRTHHLKVTLPLSKLSKLLKFTEKSIMATILTTSCLKPSAS